MGKETMHLDNTIHELAIQIANEKIAKNNIAITSQALVDELNEQIKEKDQTIEDLREELKQLRKEV